MYFDEEPKTDPKDFYDREEELKRFSNSVRMGRKLTLISGLRRSGKTSLLNTGLGLSRLPHLIVDARDFASFPRASYSDLLMVIERATKRLVEKSRVTDFLKRVRGVRVYGFEVEFERGERRPDIGGLFEELDDWAGKTGRKVIVAFDEAQLLARVTAWRFQMFLAHAYDYLKDTLFVLTGTEVGLLHDFLGVENPEAPLYGRHGEEIRLEKLDGKKSRDFLLEGFKQTEIKVPPRVVDYAVEKLDGVIGWLTAFGARAVERGAEEGVVDEVLEEGSGLVMQEFEHFLNVRMIAKKRYAAIAKELAREPLGWGDLKKSVEKGTGPIYGKNFTELLQNLIKAGFVEQREGLYFISDPVFLHALKGV